ncbi:MAG TPA: C39 family peptidase [Vicinamibacterales bacterium]|nr:C39 family peptidase [Vicinamibacterales bacterium]
MPSGFTFAVALLMVTLGAGPSVSGAATQLLDVPFVPQSEELCGGAAVAMVMRYWGAPAVYAEDFAPFVDQTAGGIRVRTLATAAQARGWDALPFAGTSADIRRHLLAGRPVIALIESRPNRYHYVVVVAWTDNRVVSHDPAEGPFQEIDSDGFERAWASSGRTALLVLPRDKSLPPSAPPPSQTSDLRELAGVHFVEKRWREAADLAAQAVAHDRLDLPAWQLLAASRFLDGDENGALDAWNQRGEPRVDLTRIDGLGRTRHQALSALVALAPHDLITRATLQRAARRLAAAPSVQLSRVSYAPHENGTANLEVAVLERPLVPRTWQAIAAASLYAVTAREARLDVASPTGNGELWTISGGWATGRPRVLLGLATPQLGPVTGLWQLHGAWEQQTYRLTPSTGADQASREFESDRRRAAVTFSDWSTANRRWAMTGALDQWRDRGQQLSLGVAMEERLFADRIAIRADGFAWPRAGQSAGFVASNVSAAWRRSVGPTGSWTGQAALAVVSAQAPLDMWPAPDTGRIRSALLRAHPLLEDDAIRGASLGRLLTNATVEYQRPLIIRPLAQLHWAAFADVARQGRHLEAAHLPWQLDLGVGLRVGLPGTPGMLRLDGARGARDGRLALSVAWQPAWPGW